MKVYHKYLSLKDNRKRLTFLLQGLLRALGVEGEISQGAIDASVFDVLEVGLVRPKVSGEVMLTTDTTKANHYTIDDDELHIVMNALNVGTNVVTVYAKFGTNEECAFRVEMVVPEYSTGEEDTDVIDFAAVVNLCGGGGGGAIEYRTNHYEDYNGVHMLERDDDGMTALHDVNGDAFLLHRDGLTEIVGKVQEGRYCNANGFAAHAEGNRTTAEDTCHAEGYETKAIGLIAHAEGQRSEATGNYSHAEGFETRATSDACHAEGQKTTASGLHAHAEGDECVATGNNAHAEGRMTKATGNKSHAEGYNTEARGENSHAEGEGTLAEAKNSHAAGVGTIAAREGQYVIGKYNVRDTEDYIFIVGNGTSNDNRSNAFAIKDDGTVVYWLGGNEFYMGLDFVEALNNLLHPSE